MGFCFCSAITPEAPDLNRPQPGHTPAHLEEPGPRCVATAHSLSSAARCKPAFWRRALSILRAPRRGARAQTSGPPQPGAGAARPRGFQRWPRARPPRLGPSYMGPSCRYPLGGPFGHTGSPAFEPTTRGFGIEGARKDSSRRIPACIRPPLLRSRRWCGARPSFESPQPWLALSAFRVPPDSLPVRDPHATETPLPPPDRPPPTLRRGPCLARRPGRAPPPTRSAAFPRRRGTLDSPRATPRGRLPSAWPWPASARARARARASRQLHHL